MLHIVCVLSFLLWRKYSSTHSFRDNGLFHATIWDVVVLVNYLDKAVVVLKEQTLPSDVTLELNAD